MKKFIFISMLMFLFNQLPAQWQVMEFNPTSFGINNVTGSDSSNIFISTLGGEIFKTIDQGSSWIDLSVENVNLVNAIDIAESGIGYLINQDGQVYKTIDFGNSWFVTGAMVPAYIANIAITDSMTIYLSYINSYSMLKSIDGGITFSQMHTDIDIVSDFHFFNSNDGFVTNEYLLKTTDGGSSFDTIEINGSNMLSPNQLEFVDEMNGWVLINSDSLYSTIDGGINWTRVTDPPLSNNMTFIDDMNGIVYNTWMAYKTHNKGISWERTAIPYYFINKNVIDNNFWICGNGGLVGSTSNFLDWNHCGTGFTLSEYQDIMILNDSTHCILDKYNPNVLFTNNDGNHYEEINLTNNDEFNNPYCAWMINSNIIFIGLKNGKILCTYNGGLSWTEIYNFNNPFIKIYDIQFIDESNGWAIAWDNQNSYILRTSDGGVSWDIQQFQGNKFHRFSFTDLNNGWVLDISEPKIYKTSNSGNSWTDIIVGSGNYYDLHFINNQVGFVAGTGCFKTIDGGSTWTQVRDNTSYTIAVHFINEMVGCILDDMGVWHTNNGGQYWELVFEISNTDYSLAFMEFYDDNYGIITAYNLDTVYGSPLILFKTYNGGMNWINETSNNEEKFAKCYPNPFINNTKLEFTLDEFTNIGLEVYDIKGMLLNIPRIDKMFSPGQNIIDLNSSTWQTGVYFCRLTGDNFETNIKLIKVE